MRVADGPGKEPGMDDNHRLLRLVSLVAWVDGDKVGLRYPEPSDTERFDSEQQVAAHRMCMYYASGVEHHEGTTTEQTEQDAQTDRALLPGFALEFVLTITDDQVPLIGDMVRRSMTYMDRSPQVNAELGSSWIEDVRSTCWRLLVANHGDCW